MITPHHWPVWGRENIIHFLKIQRDLYKYLNDQTVRRINHGQTMAEIAEELELPPSLYKEWSSRNYYGHIKHNIKATYQFYLGWFDCNPANLDPLPPEEAAKNYVECMGGESETLRKARESFEKGNYRWTATLLNHLVFANPENREARDLLADVYDQLGYQAECATWRNCYLTGAEELRSGPGPVNNKSHLRATAIANMPASYVLDYLGVSLDPAKAESKSTAVALKFTDRDEEWTWILENSALNAWPGKLPEAASEYALSRDSFDQLARRTMTVEEGIKKA